MEAIRQLLLDEISTGRLCGVSAGIWKDGKQRYREDFGFTDLTREKPMPANAIFRLYSSTKPITAAAAMLLVERGVLRLNDPVHKYIDTFREQAVLTENGLVPANRPLLLKDLLHMTSGLVYPGADEKVAAIFDTGIANALAGNSPTTQELCGQLGECPLHFQPGSAWCYGTSADVMGAVIEIAAQKPFSQFLKDEIFDPLMMQDTDFYVPAEKQGRVIPVSEYLPDEDRLQPYTGNALLILESKERPAFESGGAGLRSTMEDYARFSMMLAGGGAWNGRRILKEETVRYMRANQLTPQQLSTLWEPSGTAGYSCFMRTVLHGDTPNAWGRTGAFGWDGWAGTCALLDPKENAVFQLFISRVGADNRALQTKFYSLAYEFISK